MLGIHDFGVFLASCVVLTLTPGPDTFYILGRSLAQGRQAGLASMLGIATGLLVHTFAAALGLSAVLAASATAFLIVKLAGAAYLVWLGAKMVVSRPNPEVLPTGFRTAGFGSIYRQGLVTNLLNPKVVLFFLAFMPQFIAADSSHQFAALLALGCCFIAIGMAWSFALVWGCSQIARRLRGGSAFSSVLNRIAGGLFIALGLRLAWS